MAINWDEIYGTKTSGFVGPTRQQPVTKSTPKRGSINWDEVYKQESPKPPTNKFGVDVSNRPFNPLNPKNVLNEKQPETSVLKNLWPGLKTGLTETATSALSAWNKLQEKRRADELTYANINRKIDKKPTYNSYDEMSADSPVLKVLNKPSVQSFVKKVGESSEDLGLKFYAKQATKFAPRDQKDKLYKETLDALKAGKNDPNNGKVKKVLYGLQSALPQTAIGVMLNILPVLVTRGKDKGLIGKTLSGTYYGAISANEQLQEDGKITSPGNIAIDVFGDQLLGKSLESLFKAPAKSMLREMVKNFGVEGGTEVAQSFAKFGNDYRNARTEAERQAVMAKAKQYAKEEMLTEFAVGGISGAAITGGLSIPGSATGNTTNTAVGPAVPEDKELPPSTDAQPQFPLTRKSVDSVVRRETSDVSQEAPQTEFPLTRPVDSVVAPVQEQVKEFPTTRAEAQTFAQSTKKTEAVVEPVKPVVKPKENVIQVNNKEFQLSGDAVKKYEIAKVEYDTTVDRLQKILAKGGSSSSVEFAQKQLKAEGYKFAALKRDLTGDLTQTEIENKIKYEQSNYKGKTVVIYISGKETKGTIVSAPAFGRFKIELPDGTVVSKTAADIKDPRTTAQIRKEVVARTDAKPYEPKTEVETKKAEPVTKKAEPVKAEAKKPLPVARKIEPNPKQKKAGMLESRVAQRLSEEYEYLRTQDPVMYKALNLRSGIRVASELVVNDKEKAYRVAMGVENEPEGTTRAQVATALYVQADAEGNNELFSQLVTNLSLAASRAGQFLVSLKGSVADHSLAYYTKKVLAARLEQLGTSYLGNLQDTALDIFSKDKASHGRAIERGRAVLNQEVNEALKKIDKEKVLDINEAQKLIDSLSC